MEDLKKDMEKAVKNRLGLNCTISEFNHKITLKIKEDEKESEKRKEIEKIVTEKVEEELDKYI